VAHARLRATRALEFEHAGSGLDRFPALAWWRNGRTRRRARRACQGGTDMARSTIGHCIIAAACIAATAAFAQAPAVPRGVVYMATNFCSAKARKAPPQHGFFKVFGAVLPRPLAEGLAEAEAGGRYLLACETPPPGA